MSIVLVRSPLRVTLGGGGTDLPSYYRQNGGLVITAAIDKYVYVSVSRPFTPGINLKYSTLENVKSVDDVKHPIIREALRMMNQDVHQIDITTLADIPAGTGLGSSGSFTTALLKAIWFHQRRHLSTEQLARKACEIEINRLKQPIGKQDQYAAAYGGITSFIFTGDDFVDVDPVKISSDTLSDLEDHLLLFFTGFIRSASRVMKHQVLGREILDLALRSLNSLQNADMKTFGELLTEQWENKKQRAAEVTNSKIDEWHDLGMKNGAIGGKLVGAGGGGFLMFYAEDRIKLRREMKRAGLEEVRFRFDFEGTKVMLS